MATDAQFFPGKLAGVKIPGHKPPRGGGQVDHGKTPRFLFGMLNFLKELARGKASAATRARESLGVFSRASKVLRLSKIKGGFTYYMNIILHREFFLEFIYHEDRISNI